MMKFKPIHRKAEEDMEVVHRKDDDIGIEVESYVNNCLMLAANGTCRKKTKQGLEWFEEVASHRNDKVSC